MAHTPQPLPQTLPAAHALIAELQWRIDQLEKQLYGPRADKVPAQDHCSKEQTLMSLFPPAGEPPATQDVVVPATQPEKAANPRPVRQPQVKVLATVTERLEPAEKVCPHCDQAKDEIGCEKSERYEYVPAKVIRHEIIRPKLACRCGQGQVAIAPLPPQLIEKGLAGASLVVIETSSRCQILKYNILDNHAGTGGPESGLNAQRGKTSTIGPARRTARRTLESGVADD
jgi:hypothetical protein